MTGQDKLTFKQRVLLLLLLLSLQSCPTLCDPRDGSPPGSPVPGILQARTLEWVAISFSKAWKWKWSRSVVSDSSQPHGLQPTRLLRPRDFPGKRTGVGCHCYLAIKRNKLLIHATTWMNLKNITSYWGRDILQKRAHIIPLDLFEALKHAILIYDGRKPKNNCLGGWSGNKNWLGKSKGNFLFNGSIFWYRVWVTQVYAFVKIYRMIHKICAFHWM